MKLLKPIILKSLIKRLHFTATASMHDLPSFPYKPETFKDISYEKVSHNRENRFFDCVNLYYKEPIMITQGKMQYVWDHTGKRYLDMFGGIVTVSVGHCHPKVTQAAIDQLEKLWHVTNIYMHPNLSKYAEQLTDRFPGDLKVCFFCNSGSEANDLACLLARVYTGAFDIISLRNSYHGNSPFTMGITGIGKWKQPVANGFGMHHAMNPDPYKGPWGGSNCRDSPVQADRTCDCGVECKACDQYLSQLEEVVKCSTSGKVAAFIAESIQGVGGTVQFPKNYIKKAADLIHSYGGLCIIDEVQTGFGRTGKFWGFQNHGVVPDIVTLAKGIGNGFPLSAVVTTKEISRHLKKALVFNTFGGSPLSCAVGSAVLNVIDEEKLMENCHHVGSHLLHSLAKLRKKYAIVGDVRGKGLMIGVEMVTDKASRKPLPPEQMNSIFEDTKNMSLLLGKGGANGNVFRIKPPMCITRADADFCAKVLDTAISNHLKKFG